MRQSGDWTGPGALTGDVLKQFLKDAIQAPDVDGARREVEPFVRDPAALRIWSKEFLRDVVGRIILA